MAQSHSPNDEARRASAAGFAARLPSASWEAIPLPDALQCFVWVWFKPQTAPQGLVVTIPEETYRDFPHPEQLTMRKLLQATGVEPGCIAMWSLYGMAYDAMNGATPLLDAAIPRSASGADPTIVIYTNVPPSSTVTNVSPLGTMTNVPPVGAMQEMPAPTPAVGADAESLAEIFRRMDADWRASEDMEKALVGMRRRLVDMSNKLSALNRDLNPDERRYSSQQDKKDWTTARRWLREAAQQMSRYIKEHDIGDTSAAGQRDWLEKTYQEFIVSRRQFEGIRQAQRAYELHRKQLEKLQSNMKTALQHAVDNAEQRAQRVLRTITIKVREAKANKNFLGVMLD